MHLVKIWQRIFNVYPKIRYVRIRSHLSYKVQYVPSCNDMKHLPLFLPSFICGYQKPHHAERRTSRREGGTRSVNFCVLNASASAVVDVQISTCRLFLRSEFSSSILMTVSSTSKSFIVSFTSSSSSATSSSMPTSRASIGSPATGPSTSCSR